jgi:ATP-dependent DNA ligase
MQRLSRVNSMARRGPGRDATARFPEVVAALPVRCALLDGELVIFARDGRSDLDALRRRALLRGRGERVESASS